MEFGVTWENGLILANAHVVIICEVSKLVKGFERIGVAFR